MWSDWPVSFNKLKLFWIIDLSYYGLILDLHIFFKYGYWMVQHSLNKYTGIFIFFLNMDTVIFMFFTPPCRAYRASQWVIQSVESVGHSVRESDKIRQSATWPTHMIVVIWKYGVFLCEDGHLVPTIPFLIQLINWMFLYPTQMFKLRSYVICNTCIFMILCVISFLSSMPICLPTCTCLPTCMLTGLPDYIHTCLPAYLSAFLHECLLT